MSSERFESIPPTPEEVLICADILRRLPVGKMPRPIFTEVLKKAVLTAYEVVPLRRNSSGVTEVLLFERPENDPWWPGQFHSPGVMVIPSDVEDTSFKTTFDRLKRSELGGLEFTGHPVFVGNLLLNTERGVENANIHWLEFSGFTGRGIICDVNNLPSDLIEHHKIIIPTACEHFINSRRVNLA